MIGASSDDITISTRVDTMSPSAPPLPRRVSRWPSAMSRPKSLGASSTAIVMPKRSSARCASNRGQAGKSEKSCVKYSGRM